MSDKPEQDAPVRPPARRGRPRKRAVQPVEEAQPDLKPVPAAPEPVAPPEVSPPAPSAADSSTRPRQQSSPRGRWRRDRTLPDRDRGPRRNERSAAQAVAQDSDPQRQPQENPQQPRPQAQNQQQPGKQRLTSGRRAAKSTLNVQKNVRGGQGAQNQRRDRRFIRGKTNRLPRGGEGQGTQPKPPPIKTTQGIKARSQEGNYALSWWAARWISAMENLVDGRRLSRGRSYAREGQVLSIEERANGIVAQVQGSRLKPYRVKIDILPLSAFEWEKALDVLASQAIFAAQLLAGEMPRNIEEAFEAAGSSLFPARLGDLNTDCTCPDWANPCKHVAATHYILAERFDEDPFLIFRLRGRSNEEILTELRKRRGGQGGEIALPDEPPAEEEIPVRQLPVEPESFYSLTHSLDTFSLSFREPSVEMGVLKRLGDPSFLPNESLIADLEGVYRAVRRSALEAALGESALEDEENHAENGAKSVHL